MTNDINTLNGSIQEAIDRLESNLQEMGIYDAEYDPDTGLFGLIDMVKMIAPSMTNIELDTDITCTCPSTASVGVPFNITGTLSATYDDKSVSNVDLTNARLNGATIEIYNGDTLLTTTITDNNGNYTYAYTPLETGTLSLKAVYDSSNDYYDDSASSSVSVTVHVDVSSLSLSVSTYDKNDQLISSPSSSAILSYVDEEYAVLNATALDSSNNPVVGETVSFDIIDQSTGEVIENIDTDVTDSNGVASVTYQSKGIGDISIRASVGSILSSSYTISDRIYYNATEQSLNTTGTQKVALTSGVSISLQGKHELSFDLKSPNTSTLVALKPISDYSSSYDWIGGWFDFPYKIGYNTNPNSVTVASIPSDSNYHNFKFVIEDNDVTFYIDDVNKGTATLAWLENHSDFSFYYWTWYGNSNPQVKNISIKPL